jgi:rhodanese-related sulfurtransferase
MSIQFIEFITNHSFLIVLFSIVTALLIYHLITGNKGSLDPIGATELINRRDAVVIDVRPTADFMTGHIINAVTVPMNGFKNQLGMLEKYRDKPLIISCRSGSQSQAACMILRKAGFSEVYNLRGGIMAWQTANLPLTRRSK